ncbi:hypothetical protein [Streptomyces sp. NPDC056291]|uniref:hypothetical protein n=1 Tax=Streptomyces sp. NPDC056291 TaxID=3345772 RepID=UPI0035DEBF90
MSPEAPSAVEATARGASSTGGVVEAGTSPVRGVGAVALGLRAAGMDPAGRAGAAAGASDPGSTSASASDAAPAPDSAPAADSAPALASALAPDPLAPDPPALASAPDPPAPAPGSVGCGVVAASVPPPRDAGCPAESDGAPDDWRVSVC